MPAVLIARRRTAESGPQRSRTCRGPDGDRVGWGNVAHAVAGAPRDRNAEAAARERLKLPFNSITEVRRVTGLDLVSARHGPPRRYLRSTARINRSCPVATGPRTVKTVTGNWSGSSTICVTIAAGMVVSPEKTVRVCFWIAHPEHHHPDRVGDLNHRVGFGERPREMHDAAGLKLVRVADALGHLQGQHPDRTQVGIAVQIRIARKKRADNEDATLRRGGEGSEGDCSDGRDQRP